MQDKVRLALALSVVGGGISGAWLFRKAQHEPQPAAPLAVPNVTRSESSGLPEVPPNRPLPPTAAADSANQTNAAPNTPLASVNGGPVVDASPLSAIAPPPAIPANYPHDGPIDVSPQAPAVEAASNDRVGSVRRLPATPAQRWVTHTIRDGDTLPALALKYLGSENRSDDIFLANQQALPEPDVLPIGVELRIPLSHSPQVEQSAEQSAPPEALKPRGVSFKANSQGWRKSQP